MIGLLLRSLQNYVIATFGAEVWPRIMAAGSSPGEGFEPLLRYDPAVFRKMIAAAGRVLDRPPDILLEDMGTHILTGRYDSAPRRLLRFGGASYAEFLISLEELPDRARLALPDLDLPRLRLTECGQGEFELLCQTELTELAPLMLGMLRAMADDYGALVFTECTARGQGRVLLSVRLVEAGFAEGRRFDLAPAG